MTLDQRKELMSLIGDLSRASYMYGWHAAKLDVQSYHFKDQEQLIWMKFHKALQELENQYADS